MEEAYVGLETDQARQMKQLQEKNSRLKQLVADLSLDKTMLQDVLRKGSEALGANCPGHNLRVLDRIKDRPTREW
jgi:hypothetical protein